MNMRKQLLLRLFIHQTEPIMLKWSDPKPLAKFLDQMEVAINKPLGKRGVVMFREEIGTHGVVHVSKVVNMNLVVGWDVQEFFVPDIPQEDMAKLHYDKEMGDDKWKL